MELGLKGRKALVVGASRNIGAAIARALSDEGCRVFLVARDESRLKDLAVSLGGEKSGHGFWAGDLRQKGMPAEAVQAALHWADVDIVIHNVGGALNCKDILAPVGDWEEVWRFNVGIAIEMNRLLIPPMRQRKWGRIVHVSSIVGELGDPQGDFSGALPYITAKAYLNAYVKGLGRGLARDHVVVSGVMPGAVLSEGKFWDRTMKSDPARAKEFIDRYYPAGRFGKPEDIAPFVVMLASEHAGFASGALIPVSGGLV